MPSSPSRPGSAQTWRTTLWVWPMVSGGVAFVAAVVLTRWRPAAGSSLEALWRGGPTSAMNVLQAMATSVMTAATLIFSLTVLALQLASQQFSPRLLRRFARDNVTKRVLAVLAATFVFTTTAMSGVSEDEAVPTLAVGTGLLLGIASFGAILAFITHMVRVLRVDTMMLEVHDDAKRTIDAFYPGLDEPRRDPAELDLDVGAAQVVFATRSGFVRMTDVDALVQVASERDLLVRIEVRAGDEVIRGTPVAHVWGRTGAPGTDLDHEVVDRIRAAIGIGYERTMDQDTGFGFRQLEDIAVKAMSPSINDPVTAAHAVGHMADLLVQLTEHELGPTLHADEQGVGRAIVPDRDLRYYLDLMCGQLRRFSASEPSVLVALLRALRDVGLACRTDGQRADVRRSADAIVEGMDAGLIETDQSSVREHRERVERALVGDVAGAFLDRAGESRSM